MAPTFGFPGNVSTYVPSLHGELMVEFSRNVERFAVNKYIDVRKVPKETGYYPVMKNVEQARFRRSQDYIWPDGADRPISTINNPLFEMLPFTTKRYAYPALFGDLAVEQAAWDLLAQSARYLAAQGMTARTSRVATALTTSGNWSTNHVNTATTVGGGRWDNTSSTNTYILDTITKAVNQIVQDTNAAVQLNDLALIINPNVAAIIRQQQEMIDFLKQSPDAGSIFKSEDTWNHRYWLPRKLYGVELIIEDAVTVTSDVNAASTTRSFAFPDKTAVILSKPQAIAAGGPSISTFALLAYQEFETEVFNDIRNKRHELSVIENTFELVLAPDSGYLLTAVTL